MPLKQKKPRLHKQHVGLGVYPANHRVTDEARTRGVRNQTRKIRRRIRRGGRRGKGPVGGNPSRAANDVPVAVRPILLARKDPGLRFLPIPAASFPRADLDDLFGGEG